MDQDSTYNSMLDTTFEYEFSFDSKLNNQSRSEWQLNLVQSYSSSGHLENNAALELVLKPKQDLTSAKTSDLEVGVLMRSLVRTTPVEKNNLFVIEKFWDRDLNVKIQLYYVKAGVSTSSDIKIAFKVFVNGKVVYDAGDFLLSATADQLWIPSELNILEEIQDSSKDFQYAPAYKFLRKEYSYFDTQFQEKY